MPNPIYLQQRQDPWEALLPQLLGNLFLAKVKHGWDMETAAADIEKQIALSGKFTRTPPKVKEGEPSPEPDFSAGGEKYYRTPIAETPGQTLAKKNQFVVGGQIQQMQPDGTFKPLTEKPEGMSEAQLTERALKGDADAKAVLEAMQDRKEKIAKASGIAQVEARLSAIDVDGTAKAVIDGRETIENVKNTFGVPVQEAVRKRVLEIDKGFNFLLPRSAFKALSASLGNQEKQRGMMGSFVKNLSKQLDRVDTMAKGISRIDIRALDLPIREARTRLVGSGHERAFEAYMIEISNEIGKLSTGSQASIRELSTDAQARWAKIHDPNLSINELKKILDETRLMAKMRIESTNEEIEFTKGRIRNLGKGGESPFERTGRSTMELDAAALIEKYGGKR